MRKSPVVLFVFIFCCRSISAQVTGDDNRWMLSVTPIAAKFIMAAKSYSAIPFSGNNFGVGSSFSYQSRNLLQELRGVYGSGKLSAEDNPSATSKQTYYDISYTALFQIAPGNSSSFMYRAGGSINFLSAKRTYTGFINRDLSSESASSFSAALDISYLFKEADLKLVDRLTIPLVTYISQSEPGNGGKDKVRNKVVAIPSFLRVRNSFSLEKSLADHHSLALVYTWDYYRIKGFHEVKQASHQLGLSYCYIF
ncbi:MAG: hypothetical protein ABIR18_01840 [Chitinophagaceae bacterium]